MCTVAGCRVERASELLVKARCSHESMSRLLGTKVIRGVRASERMCFGLSLPILGCLDMSLIL